MFLTENVLSKMPQKFASKEEPIRRVPPDPQIIAVAVETVIAGGSYKGAASQFGLNLLTLKKFCRKREKTLRQEFTESEERELRQFFKDLFAIFYGLTVLQLKH